MARRMNIFRKLPKRGKMHVGYHGGADIHTPEGFHWNTKTLGRIIQKQRGQESNLRKGGVHRQGKRAPKQKRKTR